MPSEEWRKQFLDRFTNMRETLANRTQQTVTQSPVKIPTGRNGKKWYRFLHGRDLVEEVEYDDDQEEEEPGRNIDDEEQEIAEFHCREPTESLLHHFSNVSDSSLLDTYSSTSILTMLYFSSVPNHLSTCCATILAHTTTRFT